MKTRFPIRIELIILIPALLLLAPGKAQAQCAVSFGSVEITDSEANNKLDTTELKEYFNKARCQCGSKLNVTIVFSGYNKTGCSNREVLIYGGRNCYNTSTQQFDATYCRKIWSSRIQTGWAGTADIFAVPAYNLMGGTTCPSADVQTNSLFLFVDDGTGKYTQASKFDFTVDTSPPAAPGAGSVKAGEGLVEVTFGSHTSSSGTTSGDGGSSTTIKDTNFKGYQILCEELNSSGYSVGPAFSSAPSPEYEAATNVCGATSADSGVSDSSVSDAGSKEAGSDAASAAMFGWPRPLAAEAGVPDAAAGAGTEGNACKTDGTCNLGLKCTSIAGNKYCVKIPAGQEGGECKVGDSGSGYCDSGNYCFAIGSTSYCLPKKDGGSPDSAVSDMTVAADKCVGECLSPDAGVANDSGSSVDSGSTASSTLTSLDKRYVCSKKVTSPGSVTITGLKNNTKYAFYVLTIDNVKNPSSLTSLGTGTPANEEDFWERYKRAGGKADGEYCFVATAAYGDYGHPHVRVLRGFRDQVLKPTAAGKAFVQGYYQHAPGPAAWLARHDAARAVARAALWPVTLAAGAVIFTSSADKVLLLLAACMLLYLYLAARRRRRLRITKGDRA